MELPHPENFKDWKDWARSLTNIFRPLSWVEPFWGSVQEEWINIKTEGLFAVNWTEVHPFFACRFKRVQGIVYLQGYARRNGTAVPNELMFTLPEHYRVQSLNAQFACAGNGSFLHRIGTNSTGEFRWIGGSAASPWIFLDAVIYPVTKY